MFFWYKIFTYLIYPFSTIYLILRIINKKEDPVRYKEKLAKINASRESGFLIWFHVASVGEAMSILPLIEYCIEEKKINKILITSITLSSGKILKKKYGEKTKVVHQFLPLDIPVFINKFLNHWKPNLSIFIDSEIWPNLILQAAEKKIPLLLVNARITKKTFNRWRIISRSTKKLFEKFDLCISSNKESEHYLKTLGAKNIKNYGNLKFSQVRSNSNLELESSIVNKIKNRKMWCAASTHPSEEVLCGHSHLKIKKIYPDVLTIIIPRHIERVNKIYAELSKLNLKVSLYSNFNQMNKDSDILIVDSYGESIKFYNMSKYVFIGKSLVKSLINNSGQNPIEPARLGCKIFHGPNVKNFVEIYDYLKDLGISKIVNNADELSSSLIEEFKQNKQKNDEISTKIEKYGQNIFDSVVVELKKYI